MMGSVIQYVASEHLKTRVSYLLCLTTDLLSEENKFKYGVKSVYSYIIKHTHSKTIRQENIYIYNKQVHRCATSSESTPPLLSKLNIVYIIISIHPISVSLWSISIIYH